MKGKEIEEKRGNKEKMVKKIEEENADRSDT